MLLSSSIATFNNKQHFVIKSPLSLQIWEVVDFIIFGKTTFSVIEFQEIPISTKKAAVPTINVVNVHSHSRVDIFTIGIFEGLWAVIYLWLAVCTDPHRCGL